MFLGASRRLVLIAALLLPSLSLGWDDDVHMKLYYAMCRYAGIGPEVCLKTSIYAGWIDESAATTPMFPTIFYGGEVRRQFHFPGAPVRWSNIKAHGAGSSKGAFGLIAVGTPNDPVASTLKAEGFREGDLMKVGAGFHIEMDSFTHNHLAGSGHIDRGHHPDRPWTYLETDADGNLTNPRFNEMIPVIFKGLCAMRDLLPRIALDPQRRIDNSLRTPAVEATAEQLSKAFMSSENYKKISTWKTTWDPRYTRPAMQNLLNYAMRRGYLLPGDYSAALPGPEAHDGKTDPFEIFVGFVKTLVRMDLGPDGQFGQVFNLENVAQDILPGYGLGRVTFLELSEAEQDRLVRKAAFNFARGHLPRPLGMFSESVMEAEGDNRQLEMKLRHEAWDEFIQEIIGDETFEFIHPGRGIKNLSKLFCNNVGDWCVLSGEKAKTHLPISISGAERRSWTRKMVFYTIRHFWRNPPEFALNYQSPRIWAEDRANGEVRQLLTDEQALKMMIAHWTDLKRAGLGDTARAQSCAARIEEAGELISAMLPISVKTN